jgi:hypothetical protein
MQIYISKNGQQYGPYTRNQVSSYVEAGVFSSRDPAWWGDRLGWRIIGNLPCTREEIEKPIIPAEQLPQLVTGTPPSPTTSISPVGGNPFPSPEYKDTKIRKVQIVKPGQLKDSSDLPWSVRIERYFDRHNHKMEFMRTLIGLLTITLQVVILAKIFGYL